MHEAIHPKEAILLCGGKGTRLKEITQDIIPKSLFRVGGKSLIRHTIDSLPLQEYPHLILAVDHKAEQIHEWTQKNPLPYKVSFSYQSEPGILSAVACAMNLLQSETGNVLSNTDEIRLGLDLRKTITEHQKKGNLATIITTYTNHLHRHGLVTARKDGLVTSIRIKPEEYEDQPNKIDLVYAGIMLIDKRAIEYFDPQYNTDWMGIIDPLIDAGQISTHVAPLFCYFNVGTKGEYLESVSSLEKRAA
ncbi:MAG: sugar phosphate nucleotidyltransferase [Candidatus Levybacteria bacterium]|nr:sugar phosphate nucleotidyltransferase [Candidatus Levybacteria bacterium]